MITASIKPSKPQNHSERSHALLSASGASRWINCTPSARLEEQCAPVRESSSYAEEGTLAHELCELYILRDLERCSDITFDECFAKLAASKYFSEDMLEAVQVYVDYVKEEYNAAKAAYSDAICYLEVKLDLRQYVPDSFGTADCMIVSDDLIEIIDYKHGKGIPVYAEYNKQLMLYALGALHECSLMYSPSEVKLTIVQPRINNISTWQISVADLRKWAEEELRPAALAAYAGQGELKAGDWCKFCAVRNRCRALYEESTKIAAYDFRQPVELSDEEISDILKKLPMLVSYANDMAEFAKNEALNNGKIWPGFKLVEGISRRKWADEDKVVEAILANMPEATEDMIFESKLKSITELEKFFGKKVVAEKLSSVIIKPSGKPTLVPLSDKRPAMGLEEAKQDFSND